MNGCCTLHIVNFAAFFMADFPVFLMGGRGGGGLPTVYEMGERQHLCTYECVRMEAGVTLQHIYNKLTLEHLGFTCAHLFRQKSQFH